MPYRRNFQCHHVHRDGGGVAISVVADRRYAYCVGLNLASHQDGVYGVNLSANGVVEVTQALKDSLNGVEFNLPVIGADGSFCSLIITTNPGPVVGERLPLAREGRGALVAIHCGRVLSPALLAHDELIDLHNAIADANDYLAG